MNDKAIKNDKKKEYGDKIMKKKDIKQMRTNTMFGIVVGGLLGAFIFWLTPFQSFFIEKGIDVLFEPIGAFIGAIIGGIIGIWLSLKKPSKKKKGKQK